MPWAVDDYHFTDSSLNSCSWIPGICAGGSLSSLCTISRMKTGCCSVLKHHLRSQSMDLTLLSLFWNSTAAKTHIPVAAPVTHWCRRAGMNKTLPQCSGALGWTHPFHRGRGNSEGTWSHQNHGIPWVAWQIPGMDPFHWGIEWFWRRQHFNTSPKYSTHTN